MNMANSCLVNAVDKIPNLKQIKGKLKYIKFRPISDGGGTGNAALKPTFERTLQCIYYKYS